MVLLCFSWGIDSPVKEKSLVLKLNDSISLAVSIAGKGNATLDIKNKKALFLKAIKYDSIPYVFNDIAGIYGDLGQFDSALY